MQPVRYFTSPVVVVNMEVEHTLNRPENSNHLHTYIMANGTVGSDSKELVSSLIEPQQLCLADQPKLL